jgi:hypothetical protein
MADILQDLSLSTQTIQNKDYFNLAIKNLKLSKTYAIQFQWVYEDGTVGQWSPSYVVTTSNESAPAVPTNASVPSTGTGSIPVTLSVFPTNAKRVDVIITGGVFGTSSVAYSFTTAGSTTIAAPAGTYLVQLRAVSPTGVTSTVGTTFTITIADVGETIQAPTNPNGFSASRILAGVQVSWNGTYANGTFTGFEAIKIYAGTSTSATPGTYTEVGVLTGNNVKNTIVVPVDGTYVKYGQATYLHAAAVNKNGTVGTIQANVANVPLGPGKASDADINDGAVFIEKLASNVLTVGNLKAGDINATSFIRAGIAGGARIEISSSTVGSVLPGLTVYGSDGTTQLLRASLTGGLSITGNGTFTGSITGASGQFDGDLGASGGNFRVRSGVVTALAGSIGGWQINSSALKNSAVAFPNIMLDPVGSKIELRKVASDTTDSGDYIKMDIVSGLRIGTGGLPNFTVDMTGAMVSKNATIYGKIIAATNGLYSGVLTIDGGYLSHNAGMYIETENGFTVYTAKTSGVGGLFGSGYLNITNEGQVWIGSGSTLVTTTKSLNFTINQTAPFDGVRDRGYNLLNLDASEFRFPFINSAGSAGKTVVVGAFGQLYNGRALYYGTSGTSATINAEVNAAIGDLYFSTS